MARKLRPTDADRAAVVAVADLAAFWCDEPLLTRAVATLRGFVSGSRSRVDVERCREAVIASLGTPGVRHANPHDSTASMVVAEARDAVCLAVSLAGAAPMDAKQWAVYERALLGHVENTGVLSGLHDARDRVRDVWKDADAPDVPKHSPDHARLILRGQLLKRLRERVLLSVEEVAIAATKSGRKFSVQQVTRAENGSAAASTARSVYLLIAMKQDPSAFDAIEGIAWSFAEALAVRSAGVSGERWFAELVARHGEEGARYFTGVAAVIALQNVTPTDARLQQ